MFDKGDGKQEMPEQMTNMQHVCICVLLKYVEIQISLLRSICRYLRLSLSLQESKCMKVLGTICCICAHTAHAYTVCRCVCVCGQMRGRSIALLRQSSCACRRQRLPQKAFSQKVIKSHSHAQPSINSH